MYPFHINFAELFSHSFSKEDLIEHQCLWDFPFGTDMNQMYWVEWLECNLFQTSFITKDLTSPKDKKVQVKEFLDFHFKQYNDITFCHGIREFLEWYDKYWYPYKEEKDISINQKSFIETIIYDWCKEKESEPILSNKIKPMNYIQSNREEKDFRDYLLCVEEQKELIIAKLHSILDGAKPKKIASVLLALNELGYIALNDGTRASMYRGYYKSFGYSSLGALERGVNIQLNPNKNNGNTIIDEIDTYIKQLKENNI